MKKPRAPAAPALPLRLAASRVLSDPAVKAASELVDWRRLVELSCARRATSNPVCISAGVTEIYLSGKHAPALFKHLAARGFHTAPVEAYRLAVEAAARTLLVRDLHWTETQAAAAVFGSHSALVRLGAGASIGQPGHIDVSFGGAQFLVALFDHAKPTHAFVPLPDVTACETVDDALLVANAPLELPAAELQARMSGDWCGAAELREGDMVGLSGAVVHAAPPSDDNEDRGMYFLTCNLPGSGAPYDSSYQRLPWAHWYERRDVASYRRCVLEWAALGHKPWLNFGDTSAAMREETEKAAKGEADSLDDAFPKR